MEIQFNIFSVKANGIESSSSLNIGTNLLLGVESATKSVQGSGQISGDEGQMPSLFSTIDDRDWLDTPSWQGAPGELVPPWLGPSAAWRS